MSNHTQWGASSPVPKPDEELYSVAVEDVRKGIADFVHFHAKDDADARAHLVRLVSTGCFPKRTKIVAHGRVIGVLGDESGKDIII